VTCPAFARTVSPLRVSSAPVSSPRSNAHSPVRSFPTASLPVSSFTRASSSPRLAARYYGWLPAGSLRRGLPRQERVASRHNRRIYLRDWTVRLRSVVPARRIAAGLLCGFCSSARRFPL